HIFSNIWIAASARGTIVKIDVDSGEILGEYSTNPDNDGGSDPSRTTVILDGSVWVANRNGESVAHIGLPELSQCVDRNGNGMIDTSTGYGDVLPWPNPGRVDTWGGVSTAEDECILHYVRVNSSGTRHISVTRDNSIWVSGTGKMIFDLIDGQTGEILRTETDFECGGYGGLTDGNGIIWSVSSGYLLRWDPSVSPATTESKHCLEEKDFTPYGTAIDSKGWIWTTSYHADRVWKVSPDGSVILGPFSHGTNSAQGLAVDGNDEVWVSTSRSLWATEWIGHLKNDGSFVGNVVNVPLGSTGVAVDANGKIWAASMHASKAARIDPTAGPIGADGVTPIGEVDLVVDLPGANPYNYSDMTGFVALASTAPQGRWTVIQDAVVAGAEWGTITWNSEAEGQIPAGAAIRVEVRAADTVPGMGPEPWIEATSGVAFAATGRFLQLRATLLPNEDDETPVLSDLLVELKKAEVSIDDVTVIEGTGGSTTAAVFTVSLAEAISQPVEVDYHTV
ncbi:MAG: hypothetical protein GY838_14850, partial [bacterium]|nr:hypothetical protein [bacterium]